MTGDGQRRGARRDDGVSLSDKRGPKNGFGKPLRNESAGDKGTCSRAPEDLGAALRHTVSPMPWSYDSRASGGSLYPLTAGARGKYGGTYSIRNGAKYMKNTNSLSAPINSSGEQVCVLDGCLVRVKYKDCPDKDAVMANVRGILLNSYRRDNIAAEDRV